MTIRAVARFLSLITVLWSLAGCQSPPATRPAPDLSSQRKAPSGEVVGFAGEYGSHTWMGIPYAKPPVGELRWRAPEPAEPWSDTREALSLGSPCVQIASAFGGIDAKEGSIAGSEDCLFLNLWAPRFAASQVPTGGERLPVMVWIHGGGNTIGHGGFYNGGNLAVTHKLIVVTFNYRIGPLGWFRHASLRTNAKSTDDRSGNFGTLDMVRALEWVRDNVSAFGGDPGKVTIFGESAGGTNVFTMLGSPRAKGLFHRAIVESGSTWIDPVERGEGFVDRASSENVSEEYAPHPFSSDEVLVKLLIADGKAKDRAAAKVQIAAMGPADIYTYLHSKSGAEIVGVYRSSLGSGLLEMPKLFRDGHVLPREKLIERFAQRESYNAVPVMLGTNRDENRLFMAVDPELVRNFLWLFPRVRDEHFYTLSGEYMAKAWKANGADQPATAMRSAQGASVFAYRFDWDEEPTVMGSDLSLLLGAAHAFEIPFVFGHFDLGKRANMIFTEENLPARQQLSKQMMSYWAEFAYHGAPGRGRNGELPEWNGWSNEQGGPKFMVLDTAAGGGIRPSTETVTRESVLASLDSDSRVKNEEERCGVLRQLTIRSHALTRQEYAARCPNFLLPPPPS